MLLYKVEVIHRSLVKKVEQLIDAVTEIVLNNRRNITIASTTVMGVFIAFCVTVNAGTVYNYSYHGESLGAVKDKIEIIEDCKIKVSIRDDLHFVRTNEQLHNGRTAKIHEGADSKTK